MAKLLDSDALSVFCEGMAMLVAAGITTDEAVTLLADNTEEGTFKNVCDRLYRELIKGRSLAESMSNTGSFPEYALNMVSVGEESGRLENVLYALAAYYSEENRLFAKLRSAMGYPAGLLAVMTAVLVFTVLVILPVFVNVYNSVSGDFMASGFAYVNLFMGIGYAALALTAVATVVAFACSMMSRGSGRVKLIRAMEKIPLSRDAMYQMALARFTAVLATYVSAGVNSDRAMESAIGMTDHPQLRAAAETTFADMINQANPKSMPQAIYDHALFDPVHARMMLVGGRSGTTEEVLQGLSGEFFEEAVIRIDGLLDSIEPALAALLTIAVGATLIAVMLPLIGIMASIG